MPKKIFAFSVEKLRGAKDGERHCPLYAVVGTHDSVASFSRGCHFEALAEDYSWWRRGRFEDPSVDLVAYLSRKRGKGHDGLEIPKWTRKVKKAVDSLKANWRYVERDIFYEGGVMMHWTHLFRVRFMES
jgi:hypothetical protein